MRLFKRHPQAEAHDTRPVSRSIAPTDGRTVLGLAERVVAMQNDQLPEEVATFLTIGSLWTACAARKGTGPVEEEAAAIPHDAGTALYSAARLGYLTRVAEYELHEDARAEGDLVDFLRPMVAERGKDQTVIGAATWVCAGLAGQEPWDPEPDDLRSSLTGTPGVASRVRCVVGTHLVGASLPTERNGGASVPHGTTVDELHRAWLFGFYLRCVLEAEENGSFA